MPDRKPQAEQKHPDEWQRDLNPNHLAGQNIGQRSPADQQTMHVRDLKDADRLLPGFTDSEMREIPLVPAGARLEQGATYVDLRHSDRRPFTATAGMIADEGCLLVDKAEVPYQYWNRIIGRGGVERTELV
jgi:hypothetical protein